MVEQLTTETFSKAISGSTPVIIDFWAEWCGPCKQLAPIFEKISADFKGRLNFAKLNVDQHQEIAVEHGVMGIPCLIIFKNSEEIDRIVGAMPESSLKQKIEMIIGSH